MNEEKILEKVKELKENCDCWLEDKNTSQEEVAWFEMEKTAIQGLLDLYNQEKEKNKKLEEVIEMMAEDLLHYNDRNMNVVLCIATSKGDTVKDYYFNKVRGEENKK